MNTLDGRHLIVDSYCRNVELLSNAAALEIALHDIIKLVDMRVLVPATMVKVKLDPSKVYSGQDDGGITGVAILSTSHISIHTWPQTSRFSFDIFSCNEFDYEKVIVFLNEIFELTAAVSYNFKRVLDPSTPTGIAWQEDL